MFDNLTLRDEIFLGLSRTAFADSQIGIISNCGFSHLLFLFDCRRNPTIDESMKKRFSSERIFD